MITKLVRKVIGSKNDRELRRLWPVVRQTSALEPEVERLSEEELRAKTAEFRARLAGGASLDDILPEAFAAVREASRRTTGLRHFDVQLLGGVVLHQGRIAEMKTGEGKTLVATLAIYLNALEGKGAHVVTVNDYLARRDVQWMGPIYHYLGLSIGSIVHDVSYLFDPTFVVKDYRYLNLRPVERREAYRADVTYGTNNEFGFDYLRDNMKFSLDEYVQRDLHYAIVDEVDNILIDEARTPLIISGPAEESTDKYYRIDRVIPKLRRGVDYTIDEKLRNALLTEEGVAKLEQLLGVHNLYDPSQIEILHHVNQALKAHSLFKRDVDYVVKDGQVIIVDEFTGRLMPGRRWSDGLHQAVEAKEKVRIERENQTLATITIQNYFRMYKKLAGMTGTADTEAVEFKKIYNLDVVVVPTNKPLVRTDYPDVVYRTEREKFDAVIEEIGECHGRGQPVLVGTTSVEKSERLSRMLKKQGIRHNVLNAINHEAEANIIAQAGRQGAVTIATNMAGRGTDILLGGNPDFLMRAEIEHEWLSRSAELGLQEGKRYEDALRDLRERYDDAVRRATDEYEAELRALDETRGQALAEFTDARRHLQNSSPFRGARERFEEVASRLQIGGERYDPAEAERLREAREEYEAALLDVAPTGSAPDRSTLDSTRTRFDRLLEILEAQGMQGVETLVRRERRDQDEVDPIREMQRARSQYLEALGQCELATLLRTASDGAAGQIDGEAATSYVAAERAYAEAETRYQEKRLPYEQALASAEREYEETRQKYVKAVAEAREQLEKAPDQLRSRSEEVLGSYSRVCTEEHDTVVSVGGLHILGTERHESRRIDNQLRGRGGRQGDPGTSRFYLSLEDDLLRIFGAERIQNLMGRLGMEEGVPIEHRLITRAIENAQKKVEGHNFDIRKHLLEYDDVLNKQREVIYTRRRGVLGGENLKDDVLEMAEELVEDLVDQFANEELPAREWDWKRIDEGLFRRFMLRLDIPEEEREGMTPEAIEERLLTRVRGLYDEKENVFTPPVLRHIEKVITLQTIDSLWRDHLLSMDHLKEGIGLRGYGQRNPLQEYQREGFDLFEGMMRRMQEDVVEKLFTVQMARQDAERFEQEQRELLRRRAQQARLSGGATATGQGTPAKAATVRRDGEKVGRNDPCPCGSGRKFKKCCGK